MNPRPYSWIAGAILLLLGICGFVPPLVIDENDPLRIAAGVGGAQLFGIFPASLVLSGLYVLLGLLGLWGARALKRAVLFARVAGLVFLALLILGTIPGADTLFGAAPLYGNNLLLHGVLALLSLLFGWLYRRPAERAEPEPVAF